MNDYMRALHQRFFREPDCTEIRRELEEQVKVFTDNNQLVEAQRLKQRLPLPMRLLLRQKR